MVTATNPFPAGTGEHEAWERIPDPPRDPAPDEPRTEYGYARRLIAAYGGELRYVYDWRRWIAWDGQRWAPDTGQAARAAKRIARDLVLIAVEAGDSKVVRAAMSFEKASVVAAVLTLASTETEIVVRPDDLDADPFLLNVANGTLDLRTLELREHEPADLITKVTRAAYYPDAAGPEWGKFLVRVQPDEEMRDYLARELGHSLEGRMSEQVLPVWYGKGANGKSTCINACAFALGDYAATAERDLIMARSWDVHPTGVADLFGLRLAIVIEPDKGRRLAEGTIKMLTSTERVKARRMREDFWSFDPSHSMWLLCNHRPIVTGTDEGIWRRLRLDPWEIQIPRSEWDLDLDLKLQAEADAVLAWMVAGYQDWQRQGLAEPEAVVRATAAYRAESDLIGRFIAECCVENPALKTKSSELYRKYNDWCLSEGVEAVTQTAFSNELSERGFDRKPMRAGNFWIGLAPVFVPNEASTLWDGRDGEVDQ